jgi:hypothetical protein
MQFVSDGAAYEAGVCNIGPDEIRRRRLAGHVGLGAAVGLVAALIAVGAPPVTRLLVVAPAAISASGYIQARSRFCANYGWRGIFNVGPAGDVISVDDAAARAADQRRARQIGLQSLGIGLVSAVAALLLPT